MGAAVPQTQPAGGGAMGALLDLFRVLYEPGAVFERVREKSPWVMGFLGLSAIQIIFGIINLPFLKLAIQAQAVAAARPAGGPDPWQFAVVGLVFIPIVLAIIFVISAGLLWILVSLTGGEGKFTSLLGVSLYASVPSVILLSLVGIIVLRMQGGAGLTSPQDLQPAVGLDLLAPGMKGFLGAILKGINPFSIWGVVLTAIGVSTTHRMSAQAGYVVAIGSFVIGLLVAGGAGAIFNR